MTAAHAVLPSDEQRHAPGEEDLWNESYYCDFVQTDDSDTEASGGGTWGGWLRLGLYPNRQVAWWTAWVVFPGRPGLCCVDYRAPLPTGDDLGSNSLVSESDSARVEVHLRRSLEEFRLAVPHMTVLELSDPRDAYLQGADPPRPGRPVEAALDLSWTTDGVPYHYGLTSRYEIPCLVAGTVTIGDRMLAVDGHGQRDHSWGVRDWWVFGWCWSSACLDDGTRIHLADIRIPGMPAMFGYVQVPGAPGKAAAVYPVTALSVREDPDADGLPTKARIEIAAGPPAADDDTEEGADESDPPAVGLDIDVTPLAYGPVLLRDDDGRTSRFPRALVRYETDDGRRGTGWIEWNQPQPST